MKIIFSFFNEVKQEISMVAWISPKVAFQMMLLVSFFIVVFGIFFFGLDYLIIALVNMLNYL